MKNSNTLNAKDVKAILQGRSGGKILGVRMVNGFWEVSYKNDNIEYHTLDLSKSTPRNKYKSIEVKDGFIFLHHQDGGICCSPDFELYTDWADSITTGIDFVKLAYKNREARWYTPDIVRCTKRVGDIRIKDGNVEAIDLGKPAIVYNLKLKLAA